MAEVVTVNTKAIEELGADITAAKQKLLGEMVSRGYSLMVAEVPYQTGNLRQGVTQDPIDYANMTGSITVTGRSARQAGGTADVYNKTGVHTKTVSLRPSPAFNYAQAVARGRAAIRPRTAKALLIPVAGTPTGEGYLLIGGQAYVIRRSAVAVLPNPFDKRAADRLQKESPAIADAVLREFI